MSVGNWTDFENDALVASYIAMLSDELSGRSYNKAAQNRILQGKTKRSRGSIEFKLCNLSAVAKGFGLPIITGYQPRYNVQMTLAEALSRWLAQHPQWEAALHKQTKMGMSEPSVIFVGPPPTLRNTPPPAEFEQLQAIARRFDITGRDERNRALGLAGEERVFRHEQAILRQHGRDDLAAMVRWTSQEDGDGAGYDISSFAPNGTDRLIEVKTTNGWERTPFHISRNEIDVANDRQAHWHLFRLYDFAREPKAFELRPPLEAHVSLTATSFQAQLH